MREAYTIYYGKQENKELITSVAIMNNDAALMAISRGHKGGVI